MNKMINRYADELFVLFMISAIVVPIAAWFTHVIICIGDEAWGLLIAGAILFPIGIVHDIGLWFGAF